MPTRPAGEPFPAPVLFLGRSLSSISSPRDGASGPAAVPLRLRGPCGKGSGGAAGRFSCGGKSPEHRVPGERRPLPNGAQAGFFPETGGCRGTASGVSGVSVPIFSEDELRAFLGGVAETLRLYGSLEAAMARSLKGCRGDVLGALDLFATELSRAAAAGGAPKNRLVALPSSGSACKRWHLFLRWMVRCDAVDPGGWSCLKPRDLIVPVDTHMFAIARTCRLTGRRQGDLKTALEITEGFRRIRPEDPVRYDFSLTRMAMKDKALLDSWWPASNIKEGEN